MRFQMSTRWLRVIALAFVTLVAAGCGTGDGEESIDGSGGDAAPTGLRLVFEDDFGGPAASPRGAAPRLGAKIPKAPLSVRNWRVETGYGPGNTGWGNDEWQLYRNSIDNVFTEDGNLVISARCPTAPACGKRDGSITSARITTKDKLNVRYGNIQARIKMPSGLGLWPAFWMLGADFPDLAWPNAGEIDIVEMHYFYSDIFTTHFTTHWAAPEYAPGTRPVCASGVRGVNDSPATPEEEHCFAQNKTFDEPLTDDFHIFELDWNPNQIVGKIDGITYFRQAIDPATMEEFLKDYFLILNVAVGGTLGSPFGPAITDWNDADQTDMLVDWVRVYEKVKPSTATLIAEDALNLSYNRIINTAEFNGAFVETKLASTAVAPLVGSSSMQVKYSTSISKNGGVPAFFSGAIFDFNRIDLSSFSKIVFSINFSQFPGFDDIGVEFQDSRYDPANGVFDGSVLLRTSNYTPVAINGNWRTYEIPLSHFAGVNIDDVTAIGFFNPFNSSDRLIAGTLYIDDIRFVTVPCTAAGSVSLNADSYPASATGATIIVNDACAASKMASVLVDTGFGNAISVGINLNAAGTGSANFAFGATNDETGEIQINDGDLLSVTYVDANGGAQIDTANITGAGTGPSTLGVYSETHTSPVLPYSGITNSIDFFGNNTVADENSTAVTPFDGSVVLAVDYQNTGSTYGGAIFQFGSGDVSAYDTLKFSIDTSAVAGFANLTLQSEPPGPGPVAGNNVNLADYTPVSTTGNWSTYEIPLADFFAVDLTNFGNLGLWNPRDGSDALVFGPIYFDDIHFVGP